MRIEGNQQMQGENTVAYARREIIKKKTTPRREWGILIVIIGAMSQFIRDIMDSHIRCDVVRARLDN